MRTLKEKLNKAKEYFLKKDSARVLKAIKKTTGISQEDIIGIKRTPRISEARHLYCFIMHQNLGYTTALIGKFINRKHSSVLHDKNRMIDLIEIDEKSKNIYNITISLL